MYQQILYQQIFIINSDLGMGKGKIAVQVAHGEFFFMESILNKKYSTIEIYELWKNELMRKIVLKASLIEIEKLEIELNSRKIWYAIVYDKGLTQVPENSRTCLVTEPLSKELCNELFGCLKLL